MMIKPQVTDCGSQTVAPYHGSDATASSTSSGGGGITGTIQSLQGQKLI